MRKKLYIFIAAVVIISLMAACNRRPTQVSQFSTGVTDEFGNVIPESEYITVLPGTPVVITNYVYLTNEHNQYITNIVVITNYYNETIKIPPAKATDTYYVHVPLAYPGHQYFYVNYKNDGAKELWLRQIKRQSGDGKKFNIRNRDNFVSPNYKEYGDYYYFADNGDIHYAGANKSGVKNQKIKEFKGAVIIKRRKNGEPHDYYTVGGLYALALPQNGNNGYYNQYEGTDARNGVYDFIQARITRKIMNAGWTTRYVERRDFDEYYLEVLVLNTLYEPKGGEYGVDSYYHYFDSTANKEPDMPWMTNYTYYLYERPEYINPYLNKTVHFAEWNRWQGWQYSFVSDY